MLTHIMTIIAYAATTVRRDADTGAKAQADRTAILDRLLHHSHVLNIKGRSYRLKELEQAVTNQP